ncbi:unnamed protein product [Prorocentrum cordatum]|uniref:Uncharacterized protein n=1 Tax=Prorocentrum cordatum TaxID=2364126 RepID=A0ABN9TE38_9DINO|nr:unnamed protein product [Polarella glacialis]
MVLSARRAPCWLTWRSRRAKNRTYLVSRDAQAEKQDDRVAVFCVSPAARSQARQQARLARRAAAAPKVGDRVEVIKSRVPLRQVRRVPFGARGVVDHAWGEFDMQGAVASVVWDVPRLTRIGGSSIGGAALSQQDWRCFRKLADGDT